MSRAGRSVRRLRVAAALAGLALVAAWGAGGSTTADPEPTDGSSTGGEATGTPSAPATSVQPSHGTSASPAASSPLRRGEKRTTLTMPAAYTPSAPTGVGTDDYRCFLLDPGLDEDVYLTGTNVLPGNPSVVHHVILFRVPPDKVREAERLDDSTPGEGWTCFGGSGISGEFNNLDDASWLGAWAPGGKESVTRNGYGVELAPGSRIVMQVHYNLLAGASPDTSSTQIRWMPRSADLTPIHTYLMPAPVELPCRPGHDSGPLCDRDAAVADVKARFGFGPGSTADLLHLLCQTPTEPSEVSSCTRTVGRPMTILGVAGHMHLLGRSIRIEVNPGTPRARTVLRIPVWDFDNQGAKPIRPVHLDPFDTVRVTCRHVQWLRDKLPSFEGQQEKYVVWGEGTTDEMCLGLLQVTFD